MDNGASASAAIEHAPRANLTDRKRLAYGQSERPSQNSRVRDPGAPTSIQDDQRAMKENG